MDIWRATLYRFKALNKSVGTIFWGGNMQHFTEQTPSHHLLMSGYCSFVALEDVRRWGLWKLSSKTHSHFGLKRLQSDVSFSHSTGTNLWSAAKLNVTLSVLYSDSKQHHFTSKVISGHFHRLMKDSCNRMFRPMEAEKNERKCGYEKVSWGKRISVY